MFVVSGDFVADSLTLNLGEAVLALPGGLQFSKLEVAAWFYVHKAVAQTKFQHKSLPKISDVLCYESVFISHNTPSVLQLSPSASLLMRRWHGFKNMTSI